MARKTQLTDEAVDFYVSLGPEKAQKALRLMTPEQRKELVDYLPGWQVRRNMAGGGSSVPGVPTTEQMLQQHGSYTPDPSRKVRPTAQQRDDLQRHSAQGRHGAAPKQRVGIDTPDIGVGYAEATQQGIDRGLAHADLSPATELTVRTALSPLTGDNTYQRMPEGRLNQAVNRYEEVLGPAAPYAQFAATLPANLIPALGAGKVRAAAEAAPAIARLPLVARQAAAGAVTGGYEGLVMGGLAGSADPTLGVVEGAGLGALFGTGLGGAVGGVGGARQQRAITKDASARAARLEQDFLASQAADLPPQAQVLSTGHLDPGVDYEARAAEALARNGYGAPGVSAPPRGTPVPEEVLSGAASMRQEPPDPLLSMDWGEQAPRYNPGAPLSPLTSQGLAQGMAANNPRSALPPQEWHPQMMQEVQAHHDLVRDARGDPPILTQQQQGLAGMDWGSGVPERSPLTMAPRAQGALRPDFGTTPQPFETGLSAPPPVLGLGSIEARSIPGTPSFEAAHPPVQVLPPPVEAPAPAQQAAVNPNQASVDARTAAAAARGYKKAGKSKVETGANGKPFDPANTHVARWRADRRGPSPTPEELGAEAERLGWRYMGTDDSGMHIVYHPGGNGLRSGGTADLPAQMAAQNKGGNQPHSGTGFRKGERTVGFRWDAPALADLDDAGFARRLLDASIDAPSQRGDWAPGHFDDGRVYITELYDRLGDTSMSVEQFKQRLAQLQTAGKLKMGRQDVPFDDLGAQRAVMDEVKVQGASFHFLNTPATQKLYAGPDYAKMPKADFTRQVTDAVQRAVEAGAENSGYAGRARISIADLAAQMGGDVNALKKALAQHKGVPAKGGYGLIRADIQDTAQRAMLDASATPTGVAGTEAHYVEVKLPELPASKAAAESEYRAMLGEGDELTVTAGGEGFDFDADVPVASGALRTLKSEMRSKLPKASKANSGIPSNTIPVATAANVPFQPGDKAYVRTSTAGEPLKGTVQSVSGSRVKVKTPDGATFDVPADDVFPVKAPGIAQMTDILPPPPPSVPLQPGHVQPSNQQAIGSVVKAAKHIAQKDRGLIARILDDILPAHGRHTADINGLITQARSAGHLGHGTRSETQGAIAGRMKAGEGFAAAVRARLTPDEKMLWTKAGKQLDLVAQGKVSFATFERANPELAPRIREVVQKTMQRMQDNSAQLEQLGAIAQGLTDLRDNGYIEQYVTNLYRVYYMAPGDWAKIAPEKNIATFVDFALKQHKGALSEAEVMAQLMEVLQAGDTLESLRNSGLGKPFQKLLERDRTIPPEVRGILGQENSGVLKVAATLANQEVLLAKLEFWQQLTQMRDADGVNRYWSPGPIDGWIRLDPEQKLLYGSAAGGYIRPELASLKQAPAAMAAHTWGLWRTLGATAKQNMVVLGGFATWTNNFMRNIKCATLAGGLDVTNLKGAAKYAEGFRLLMEWKDMPVPAGDLALVHEARAFGALPSGFGRMEASNTVQKRLFNALKEELRQKPPGTAYDVMNLVKTVFERYNAFAEGATAAYDFIDQFWKFGTYLQLREKNLAQGMSVEEAAREASRVINRCFPNFEHVSPLVERMRSSPMGIVAPFLSGVAEDVRINALFMADLAQMDKRAWRGTGNLMLMASAVYGAAKLSQALSGLPPEEVEAAEAVRTKASQQHRSLLVAHGYDSQGRVSFWDLSQWVPESQLSNGHPDDPAWRRISANLLLQFFEGGLAGDVVRDYALEPSGFLTPMKEPPGELQGEEGVTLGRAAHYIGNSHMVPGFLGRTAETMRQGGLLGTRGRFSEQRTLPQVAAKVAGLPQLPGVGPKTATASTLELKADLEKLDRDFKSAMRSTRSPEEKKRIAANVAERRRVLLEAARAKGDAIRANGGVPGAGQQ